VRHKLRDERVVVRHKLRDERVERLVLRHKFASPLGHPHVLDHIYLTTSEIFVKSNSFSGSSWLVLSGFMLSRVVACKVVYVFSGV